MLVSINIITQTYVLLYRPRTQDLRLPFQSGEGSRAALEGAARKGVRMEQEGARGQEEARGNTIGQCRGAVSA